MSYKYTVLQDKPTSFYMLDEIRSGTIGSYLNLLDRFATYQDLKDNGISYSSISGLPIYDYSGNSNDGYAINASDKELMPIVHGTVRGTEVLPETQIALKAPGIATKFNSDDSFAIEIWVKLPEDENASQIILGDTIEDFGIFYENSKIKFKVGNKECFYKVSNKEAIHVVAQFSSNKIWMYVNGIEVSSESLDSYKFTNTLMNFDIGPVPNKIFIDAIAFYRFNLSPYQIKKHYNEGTKETNYSQIVSVDEGYLFSINSSRIKPALVYSYPLLKSWDQVADEGIVVSEDQKYLKFKLTDVSETGEFEFIEEIFIPSHLGITTSQIYWEEDYAGIDVYASVDNQNWEPCLNGSPLPFINKNENLENDLIYIKVVMSSTDTTSDFTQLKSLTIKFFKDKVIYADNFGYSITSSYDYSIPEYKSRILLANKCNGIKMYDGHGFTVNSDIDIKTVEMIYTPQDEESVLLSTNLAKYEWSSNGLISKNGIALIYVNGINRTSSTNINEFLSNGIPHHIVVILNSPGSNLKINQNQEDTKYGFGQMYSNLAIYNYSLLEHQIDRHYKLYTGNLVNLINDTSFSIQESNTGNDSTPFVIFSVQADSISV